MLFWGCTGNYCLHLPYPCNISLEVKAYLTPHIPRLAAINSNEHRSLVYNSSFTMITLLFIVISLPVLNQAMRQCNYYIIGITCVSKVSDFCFPPPLDWRKSTFSSLRLHKVMWLFAVAMSTTMLSVIAMSVYSHVENLLGEIQRQSFHSLCYQ